MNPSILKANNNYPFKTTARFRWYIALENGNVVGFLPVEEKSSGFMINNYYFLHDDPDILKRLLDGVSTRRDLYAIVQVKHESIFIDYGFQIEFRWTNYVKMRYNSDRK